MNDDAPRVVFDGSVFAEGRVTGVGRSFLHGLKAYVDRPDTDAIILVPADCDREVLPPRLKVAEVAAPRGFFQRSLRLPSILRRLRAAVWHSPVTALPRRAPCPMIATVHDVPWADPHAPADDDAGGLRHRLALRHAGRAARLLISVSQTTHDCAERALGGGLHAKHVVVHHGVPTEERRPAPEVRRGPIVVLSPDRPRKNLQRIRAAHALARAEHAELPALRIVGSGHSDFIDEREKRQLLQQASALACVSLTEGFGLPVLEGFAAGCPVLCSNRGALAEIADDAAHCVDPLNVRAIADGMLKVCGDAALRSQLVARGNARLASRFTPELQAERWLAVHRSTTAVHAERRRQP